MNKGLTYKSPIATIATNETLPAAARTWPYHAQSLDAAGLQRLKDWVQSGGTLVGLGSAVNVLADSRLALLEIRQENALRAGEGRGGGPERDDVLVWLKRDPVYDPLRPHPRFQALLRRIALP